MVTFSLSVKQQRIWKCQAAEAPTCLSSIKMKMQSLRDIGVVINLIATALHCNRTDLIPCKSIYLEEKTQSNLQRLYFLLLFGNWPELWLIEKGKSSAMVLIESLC